MNVENALTIEPQFNDEQRAYLKTLLDYAAATKGLNKALSDENAKLKNELKKDKSVRFFMRTIAELKKCCDVQNERCRLVAIAVLNRDKRLLIQKASLDKVEAALKEKETLILDHQASYDELMGKYQVMFSSISRTLDRNKTTIAENNDKIEQLEGTLRQLEEKNEEMNLQSILLRPRITAYEKIMIDRSEMIDNLEAILKKKFAKEKTMQKLYQKSLANVRRTNNKLADAVQNMMEYDEIIQSYVPKRVYNSVRKKFKWFKEFYGELTSVNLDTSIGSEDSIESTFEEADASDIIQEEYENYLNEEQIDLGTRGLIFQAHAQPDPKKRRIISPANGEYSNYICGDDKAVIAVPADEPTAEDILIANGIPFN